MKLWQIKAQSLRIMFADSDLQFNEQEFIDEVLTNNSNTADKMVRMEDSIRRGIDRYYEIVGEQRTLNTFNLSIDGNYIDFTSTPSVGIPERIDAKIYDSYVDELGTTVKTLRMTKTQINFIYDSTGSKVYLEDEDYTVYGENVSFVVWYKLKRLNIPDGADEMTYDLDDILIPEEVQRMLCFYVKGELYEEDEANVAQFAEAKYINFLRGLKKPFSNVQTKVKRSRVFTKDN